MSAGEGAGAGPGRPGIHQARRRFVAAGAGLGAVLAAGLAPFAALAQPAALPAARGGRALVVGGGWGGLAAARRLKALAPDLEVVLVERNPVFRSLPLSNAWLVGRRDTRFLLHDYRAAAAAHGYAFVQAEATRLDREARRVHTSLGDIPYDWLVLAPGIRDDWSAWFGDDRRAAEAARARFAPAFVAGEEGLRLRSRLEAFRGGDLVMTVPPMPYRCPPAPFERACLIAWSMRARKLPGKVFVLDPNPPMPAFERVFRDHFADRIVYQAQARIRFVDPHARKIETDFDELRFDDAILMPPQQAGDLAWQAGLIGRDAAGKPTGWVAADPLHLHVPDDERIFVVGDALDRVSPLFGFYPKSGHLAARLGAIAAEEIAARRAGREPPVLLPDGVCHVQTNPEPDEAMRLDVRFRLRGDGVIVQTATQTRIVQPQGEDVEWARGFFREFFGEG
ncbi:MAG: NAD(P)/FAD-dependent oxidoreductase [Rhodocyclaceae bacterium]|nr:NAD(P)/FAD-dependent oxidoreductase [Rhodocyclaceae bacterium]